MPPRHHKTEAPGPIQNILVPNGSQVRSVSARHRSGWSLRNRRHLAPSRYDVPGGGGTHRTGVPVPRPIPSLGWKPMVRVWTKDIRTPGFPASLPCRSRGTDLRSRRSDRANRDFRGWKHARCARHPRADHPRSWRLSPGPAVVHARRRRDQPGSQHHYGYVLSGRMRARSRKGPEVEAGLQDRSR